MKLNAVRDRTAVENKNSTWYKKWNLTCLDTGRVYGTMIFNSYHEKNFSVFINSNVHPELGCSKYGTFSDRAEALVWARSHIEKLSEPTVLDIKEAIDRAKDARRCAEMSDDFAYTNGKIARWDRIIHELEEMLINRLF